jgi:hypothetical protein
VFRTYDPSRDRLVAVKAFRLDLIPEQARALADELQRFAEAELDHPSIVRPIAAGVEGTLAYAASEYVAAESLDIALRHYAPAAIDKVLPFITQLAGAIDFARTAGIGHGALHPRDVFVTPDEARASGFGVVQALESIGQRAPTRRPYTAPERVDGGAWDVRADVYSLGAIACELLTGRRPVGAEIGALGPGGGPHAEAIANVLSRALAESPDARFPSALGFAAALEAASRGERTTTAVEEVRAVAEAPMAPALAYEYDEGADAGFGRADAPPVDGAEAELDADVAEIQLREEEAARATGARDQDDLHFHPPAEEPTVLAPYPEDRVPRPDDAPVFRDAGSDAESPSLFDVDAVRDRDAVSRFGTSEFEETGPAPTGSAAAGADEHREGFAVEPIEPIEPIEPVEPIEPPPPPRRRRSPRPVLLPVALTLLLGLFVGFLAGYLVGARDRGNGAAADETPLAGEVPAEEPSAQAPPPTAAPSGGPATQPPSAATPRTTAPAATPAGRLIVRSTPPGAQVFVNGRRRGTTPLSLRNLAAGTYTLRLTRSGFDEATQRVSVAASGVRDVSVRLTRERATPTPASPPASAGFTGSLFVDSRPRGARVLLDGRDVGTTPLQLPDVRAGAHVVRMELPEHRAWTSSTRVVAGQTVRVTGSLERQP